MIESTLQELTTAVRELNALLRTIFVDNAEPIGPEALQHAQVAPPEPDLPAPQAEAQIITIDDVRDALLLLGRDGARALLAEYDVKRLPDLHPGAYLQVVEEAKRRAA